ncbi:hypothetical protein ACFQX6_51090 [Streptosporangium lutulentum]
MGLLLRRILLAIAVTIGLGATGVLAGMSTAHASSLPGAAAYVADDDDDGKGGDDDDRPRGGVDAGQGVWPVTTMTMMTTVRRVGWTPVRGSGP